MKTVLIVDDLPENLYLLKTMLESFGYAVRTAVHGAEALALARAHPPDIVIADILMPVMDGFTLCRAWRQDPALWKIPFIIYTATYTDAKDERLALDTGADRFIGKPAEPDIIVAAVQDLLANGRPAARPTGLQPEVVYLKEYNEALIRKLEDKLKELEQANLELRALDGFKNNLLANVSHELRTPLVAVRGFAEMIASGLSGPVTDRQREQCEVMLRNIERLLVSIDNLLHLAATDRIAISLDRSSIAADELLGEARILLAGKAREKQLDLRAEPAPGITVGGDRRRLLQVLINLVDNAIKFTPEGGEVILSAGATAGGVHLSVRDTGPGIEAADQPRIFDRFFQADSSSTRGQGGLGIGLSIARDIVTRHGGTIAVRSAPGTGSEFVITLPA